MIMKLPQIILAILVLVFIGQIAYFYPQLPATIASHFDASGQANGFASKITFFVFEAILLAILLTMFLSLPKLISKLPDSSINLPNKDYWLSPERRGQTFASFGHFFGWLSAAVVAPFIAINQIVLTANVMKKDPNPLSFGICLGVFFALDAVLVFVYLRRFFGRKTT